MSLRLDWCSHEAAKYAVVMHWHYSRSLPSGATVKCGVWEGGSFIGCVVFAMGATPNLAIHHRLPQTEICELSRVALAVHCAPVSRIVRIAIMLLRQRCPGIRLIVSFADADRDHHGGIYQAGGWTYLGLSNAGGSQGFIVRGQPMHRRSVGSSGWSQSLSWLRAHVDTAATEILTRGKHKYVYVIDPLLMAHLIAKPYPKRVRSAEIGTEAPTSGGGEIPTRTLHQAAS